MKRTTQLMCLVVGDSGSGKTSLLHTYATKRYPKDHLPTVFNNFIVPLHPRELNPDNCEVLQKCEMTVCDSTTQDGYNQMRQTLYSTSDLVVICFALDRLDSLHNVTKVWLPEIQHFSGPHTVPVILVGTKSDLRNNPNITTVPLKTTEKVAKKCRALAYVECSALTHRGLTELFDKVCTKIMDNTKKLQKHKHPGWIHMVHCIASVFSSTRST